MKKYYLNAIVILTLFLCIGVSQSQNLITDGDFSSTTEITEFTTLPQPMNQWSYWLNYAENVAAFPTVEDEACKFEISNAGGNTWSVQLIQFGVPLMQGHLYELSFDVKSDSNRSFGVFLGEDGGSYFNLIGANYLQNATPQWQTITIPFDAFAVFQLHKLSFELGTDPTTIYFDNVNLIDVGTVEPSIGILGTAVNGWYDDVNMETIDGINYYLNNFPLNLGELKFRENDNWDVNWGGDAFPSGYGIFNGPNLFIPYTANFDITFNRLTTEYNFECISNCPLMVGLVGSALNGWENDVGMQTADGVNYTLDNFYFMTGEAKFRQDGNWAVNWGSDTFPTGIAVLDGPNIPVTEGFYSVTFNHLTGEYSFNMPSIGILGSALNGWDVDIDMQSDNGITYTLDEHFFSDGSVKFRQNDTWFMSWGGITFPYGIALESGPDINVPEGSYTVIFNRLTSEYSFTATTCPNPELVCPNDIYVNNYPGMCGAEVFYDEIIPVPNCGGEGITITQTSGLPSGSFFPVGTTTNSFEIINATGITASCSFNVFVFDNEPPVIMNLNQDYEPLWPPNHKMIDVFIDYSVSDNCGATVELSVSSNESENGLGDGDLYPDWEIIDEHHVLLRAERSGKRNGREYYITITVYDDSMNYTEQQVIVMVPHDRKDYKSQVHPVLLYPNAANKVINMKGLEASTEVSYQIFDMFGILKDNGVLQNKEIDISELAEGLYIIKFKTEKGNYFKKFMKSE